MYNPIENTTIDLRLALALVTALSIVLFVLTCWLTNNLSKKAKLALAAVATGAIVAFVSLLLDSHWLLVVLPFQAAIIYADLLLPLAAILAGVVWQTKRAPSLETFAPDCRLYNSCLSLFICCPYRAHSWLRRSMGP